MINSKKLDLLQHSLGINERVKTECRNHFVVNDSSEEDLNLILEMVQEGLMKESIKHRDSELIGGSGFRLFYVTDLGKQFVVDNRPKEVKLSKAKLRYKKYLEVSECYNSFLDFCKSEDWKKKQLKREG